MDEHLILEFDTQQAAETELAVINELAAAYWIEQGFTVIIVDGQKCLVGKNAATGQDNPEALTKTWDIPRERNGKWVFDDPANDARFSLWRERAIAAGYTPVGVPVAA